MKQGDIGYHDNVQVQSEDLIGVIAGQGTSNASRSPQGDEAPGSSFEMAWALAH